jgi:hypothetical protein
MPLHQQDDGVRSKRLRVHREASRDGGGVHPYLWPRYVVFVVFCTLLLLVAGCAGETIVTPTPTQTPTSLIQTPRTEIDGLRPGEMAQVPVTFENPGTQLIEITDISMNVVSVTPDTCPRTSLRLDRAPRPIVAPQDMGTVNVTVLLFPGAPLECSEATWVVEFSSTAALAR